MNAGIGSVATEPTSDGIVPTPDAVATTDLGGNGLGVNGLGVNGLGTSVSGQTGLGVNGPRVDGPRVDGLGVIGPGTSAFARTGHGTATSVARTVGIVPKARDTVAGTSKPSAKPVAPGSSAKNRTSGNAARNRSKPASA